MICSFPAAAADADEALGSSWRRFTYSELKQATGGFAPSALLGEGAYGKVYVATLANGSQVAVKQLKSGNKVRRRGFGGSDLGLFSALGVMCLAVTALREKALQNEILLGITWPLQSV